ncbi:MAG: C1 family peptidase [Candidatus Krumholzibacteria bacterium]|nr:C1 family peptidase [Candidatus Krumholzibacteria bacterium]
MKVGLKTSIVSLAIVAVLLLVSVTVMAGDRGIDKKTLKEIKKSFELTPGNRALMNAVSNNDIRDLTFNREIYNEHNEIYTDKVEAKGITNQKSSGRCWMFAGLNMMRPAVIKNFKLDEFEFSENYLFFYDKLEKANLFLEAIIETADRDIDDRELQALLKGPVPDGGWWNYYADLIDKYGAVPQCVSQETKHTSGTRRMNGTLDRMARVDAVELRKMAAGGTSAEEMNGRKVEMLKDFYRILVLHMGEPVERFTWRVKDKDDEVIEKEYTPLSFYKDAVGIDLQEYVSLFDYPAYEYNKYYEVNYCRNLYDRPDMGFINLGAEELKKYAIRAIQDGEPVWFSADIGKENDGDHGILKPGMYDYDGLFGIDREISKSDLIKFRGGSPNHAMVFVAVDLKDGKPVKWKVENSWGTSRGAAGFWAMYDEWFSKYVFSVIVHRKHLPAKIVRLLDTEPQRIPAWDPMRSAFDGE